MDKLNYESDSDASTEHVLCEICNEREKQYKCPRCSCLTCSLQCCREHKQQTGCNGIRDRTAYVGMKSYGDTTLRNDYHFLEDLVQSKDSAKRTMIATCGDTSSKKKNNRRPYTQNTLLQGAKLRNMKLSLMPAGMSKRIHNTSRYIKKADLIYWKVHILFVLNANYTLDGLLNYELNGVSEDGCLVGVMSERQQEIPETTSMMDIITAMMQTNANNLTTRHYLRPLRTQISSLVCYLHKKPSPANQPVYYEILLDQSLRNALSGKCIVEYPTFIVGARHVLKNIPLYIGTITDEPMPVSSDESEEELDEHPTKRMRSEIDDSNEIPIDEEEDESFIKELEMLASSDIESLKKIIAEQSEEGCV